MRASAESMSDGYLAAVKEARTVFRVDEPPSAWIRHVLDMLSVDKGSRVRPRGPAVRAATTRASVAARNFAAVAEAAKALDTACDDLEVLPVAVIAAEEIVRARGSGAARRIETRDVLRGSGNASRARFGSAAEADAALGPSEGDVLRQAVPLLPGTPVVVSMNIYDTSGEDGETRKLKRYNGERGVFVGWSKVLPVKEEGIRGSFGEKRPPLIVDDVRFRQVTVRELARLGIAANVDFGGADEPLVAPIKTVGASYKKAVFPLRAAKWVTVSSLQGQTIDGRLHVDFAGAQGVFDPQMVYMVLSRVPGRTHISIENLCGQTLVEWWARVRRAAAEPVPT